MKPLSSTVWVWLGGQATGSRLTVLRWFNVVCLLLCSVVTCVAIDSYSVVTQWENSGKLDASYTFVQRGWVCRWTYERTTSTWDWGYGRGFNRMPAENWFFGPESHLQWPLRWSQQAGPGSASSKTECSLVWLALCLAIVPAVTIEWHFRRRRPRRD